MSRAQRMKKYRWRFVIPALLATAVLAAGCGSSSSGSSSGSGGSASTSSATKGDATAQADAKAAAAKIAKLQTAPTSLGLTDALPKAPPKGTMVWMQCDVPACTLIGGGVKAGVQAAGWNFKTENYLSANPATLVTALKEALALHPTAVTLSGIPPADGWSSVIPAYKAAGVPIITIALGPTPLTSTLVANVGGPTARYADGVNIANWFIADSGGHGDALLQRDDGFPILGQYADAFAATVKKDCSECKITTLSSTLAQATGGTIPQTIVPQLEANKSINYLISADLEFLDGLPPLMNAAGLKGKIKVAGATPTTTGQAAIKNGTWTAATPGTFVIDGWVAADAAFREAMHLPVPAEDNGPLPTQLMLTGNSWTVSPSYNEPADYAAQFKKLWKLG